MSEKDEKEKDPPELPSVEQIINWFTQNWWIALIILLLIILIILVIATRRSSSSAYPAYPRYLYYY